MHTYRTHRRSKPLPKKPLLALVAACSLLGGAFGAGTLRAADGPKAKEADVQKMEAALPDKAPATPKEKRKVLVYGNANGFVHGSIPLGEEFVAKLGEKTGAYTATVSNDPAEFDADKLKDFDAVVLVSTTGHFLVRKADEAKDKEAEKQRMQNLIDFVEKDGKGLVGFHAATDAYYDDRAYGDLIGGYFNGHHAGQEKIAVVNEDPKSPLTAVFGGKGFDFADEIYRFTPKGKDGKDQSFSREKVRVLLSVDVTKNNNEKPGTDMPVAWIHKAGKGRVFYSSLGHNEFVYWNPEIQKFYLAGIQYALGDLDADATPSKAGSARTNGTAGAESHAAAK